MLVHMPVEETPYLAGQTLPKVAPTMHHHPGTLLVYLSGSSCPEQTVPFPLYKNMLTKTSCRSPAHLVVELWT